MAKFIVGKPITTTLPGITVDAGLPTGQHRFQLEVVDTAGNRSQADAVVVTIKPSEPIPSPQPVQPVRRPG
jgi:hypothetical protein